MSDPLWWTAVLVAYLVGSIPFGLLIGRAKGVDIRAVGSGNIGATNLGRALGSRTWGLICFVLDLLKGAAPVALAGAWFGWLGDESIGPGDAGRWVAVGVAAICGHVFPVYLGFKGGKGVATGFGVVLGVWPFLTLPALGALLTWLLFASALRYVGLASVVAAMVMPVYFVVAAGSCGWPLGRTWPFVVVAGAMALLVTARHRGNLVRLAHGVEPRLGGPRTAR